MKFTTLLALACCAATLLPSTTLAAGPSKLKGASSSSRRNNEKGSVQRGGRGLKAKGSTLGRSLGPPQRECKSSNKYSTKGDDVKQEVKVSCKAQGNPNSVEASDAMARGIFLDPADLRDKIEYKVKADTKNGVSVKVEYKQEYKEEEGVDDFTDTATSFEVKFGSIIEYAKMDGLTDAERSDEDQAYDWENDLVLQTLELSSFQNFTNITQVGDLSYWSVTTMDRVATFNFTISQASMGEKATANTMKIDVLILNFPWLGNDTNLALMSEVKAGLKVELDYAQQAMLARAAEEGFTDEEDDKKPKKISKWTRDVVISFEDVTADLGFSTFGEYTWDDVAEASIGGGDWSFFPDDCSQPIEVQRTLGNNSQCGNATTTEDESIVVESDTIRVVGTYAPSFGNETHQHIAYSFVGSAAHRADEIYWDPEAGIGYQSAATAMSNSIISLLLSTVMVTSGFLYMAL